MLPNQLKQSQSASAQPHHKMQVIKRNGESQPVRFDKITNRIEKLLWNIDPQTIDATKVSQKVCQDIHDGIHTTVIDELAAQTAQSMVTYHPNYGTLAARIVVSNLHKNTNKCFYDCICQLNTNGLIADWLVDLVKKHKDIIQNEFNFDSDYRFDYFGFKTLEKSYLMKINNPKSQIIERPQHLFMRVALGIHGEDLESAFKSYNFMRLGYFTHATPTLFNAGTRVPQLASCYLQAMKDDSIVGIYDTLKDSAQISKWAGGIGVHIHNVRGRNALIKSNGGRSTGIIPMLKVFNDTGKYVNQSGKRNGSIAVYLEPWHCDILDFLELRKNHGDEDRRARDLFTALWVPDLFMERVKSNGVWSLMSPDVSPGLSDVYGADFKTLYEQYESEGKYIKQVQAQEVWFAILTAQTETGTPYLLFKDAANSKSNQKNLGVIKSSNLCAEIIEYSDKDETAVCNLASICLPMFVKKDQTTQKPYFDYNQLHEVTKCVTNNLNRVIDKSFYPIIEANNSNTRHRPIGIGTQGLADVFMKMRVPYDSNEAKQLNSHIFETIYHGALTASAMLAETEGSYSSFEGSPASQGILQYDMWNVVPSDRWDWAGLKEKIQSTGLRNSLLLAQMPTASTAQIMGNNEGTEIITTNVYNRRTSAGEFTCVNKYLIEDLFELGLWNEHMASLLIQNEGSVQNIETVPQELKDLYKTTWEISQRHVIDMAADRGAFICQSQSMNLYLATPTTKSLSSMYFYAHQKGLKTGVYYLRTNPRVTAVKVALPVQSQSQSQGQCSLKSNGENNEECLMCSA